MGFINTTVDKKIEDLAGMTARGFSGINERFDKMDQRIDKVDQRLGDANGRLDTIESDLIEIKRQLNNVIYRHEFEAIKDRIDALEKRQAIQPRKK